MALNQIDILAFAAHPDDVEISASGTLLVYKSRGYTTGIIDLTKGEMGTRGNAETRLKESQASSKILQLDIRENLGMEDCFFRITSENIIKVVSVIRRYKPRIVLANSIEDRHPDHSRAAQLVAESCFYAGLPKIETGQPAHRPQNLFHYVQDYYIHPGFVIDVSEHYLKKMEALQCYKTQFYNPNSLEPETPISGKVFFDFLTGRMRDFGRTAQYEFAEGFTFSRYPGINDIFNLH